MVVDATFLKKLFRRYLVLTSQNEIRKSPRCQVPDRWTQITPHSKRKGRALTPHDLILIAIGNSEKTISALAERAVDDIAQDTFIWAFEHLDQYQPNTRFYTWLTLPPYKIAYITRTPMLLTSLLAVSDSKAPIHFDVYVCAKSPASIEGLRVEQIETIRRHLIETPEMEESELDSVVEPGFIVTRLTGSLEPDQLKDNLAISLDFLPVERR
jgi:hypothetical protein